MLNLALEIALHRFNGLNYCYCYNKPVHQNIQTTEPSDSSINSTNVNITAKITRTTASTTNYRSSDTIYNISSDISSVLGLRLRIYYVQYMLSDNKLRQGQNVHQQWSEIWIWISGLLRIWIQMCARSLPKCCGFITLSAPVILPKIGRWLYEKC